jgi:hypothetical protein
VTTKVAFETSVKRKEAPEAQGIGKLAHYPSPTSYRYLRAGWSRSCLRPSGVREHAVDDKDKKTGAGDGGGTYLQE